MERISITDILQYLDELSICYTFSGDPTGLVSGFASLSRYRDDCFTWVKTQKNADSVDLSSPVYLAFLQTGVMFSAKNCIVTDESKRAFFSIIEHFFQHSEPKLAIGIGTYLSSQVTIGKNVIIGCNCVLDGEITIGEGSRIGHNVTILNHVEIGKNCAIQSGCRIGEDGFAFTEDSNHVKTMVRHYGGVKIGDSVLISSNTAVVRGTIDDTQIMDGCKIDTLCHIAHNVIMERNCSIITNTLLFGSVHVMENGYVASGLIRNQCTIGENAIVGMGAVVTKSVPANTIVVGNPAKPLQKNGDGN